MLIFPFGGESKFKRIALPKFIDENGETDTLTINDAEEIANRGEQGVEPLYLTSWGIGMTEFDDNRYLNGVDWDYMDAADSCTNLRTDHIMNFFHVSDPDGKTFAKLEEELDDNDVVNAWFDGYNIADDELIWDLHLLTGYRNNSIDPLNIVTVLPAMDNVQIPYNDFYAILNVELDYSEKTGSDEARRYAEDSLKSRDPNEFGRYWRDVHYDLQDVVCAKPKPYTETEVSAFACSGDSGGPLVMTEGAFLFQNITDIQFGIASYAMFLPSETCGLVPDSHRTGFVDLSEYTTDLVSIIGDIEKDTLQENATFTIAEFKKKQDERFSLIKNYDGPIIKTVGYFPPAPQEPQEPKHSISLPIAF